MIKVGHRVFIRSIKRKGSVEFIDWPRLSLPYFYPIQVKLDEPFSPFGHYTAYFYRTSIGDLELLDKKKKKKKKKPKKLQGLTIDCAWVDEFTNYMDTF